ncbi:unnamed protein product, partial [Staurois parvus]
MKCVHDLTNLGLLCIHCSSALISLPGSNLISIPGSNLISFLAISSAFLAAISSAFLAAISSASLSIIQNMAAVSSSCSLNSNSECKTPPLH